MLRFAIYKPGQGLFVRWGTVAFAALLVLVGLWWLSQQILVYTPIAPATVADAPSLVEKGAAAVGAGNLDEATLDFQRLIPIKQALPVDLQVKVGTLETDLNAALTKRDGKPEAVGAGWRLSGPQWLIVKISCMLLFGFGCVFGIFTAVNQPKPAEFMIMTESEMRKVNWPTRREVINSTKVVIFITLMLGVMLFGVDSFFNHFFNLFGLYGS